MLELTRLSHSFGSLQVLEELNFSAGKGEFVAIVGPTGCGKTVLLKIVAGLVAQSSGEVRGPAGSSGLAFAFQKSPLFPWMSLRENVRLCMGGNDRDALIDAYFKAAGLASFAGERPGKISGGMRQKVNVIRAFCSGRPLLLMDEPFVSLDFPSRRELQQLTLELWAKEQKTILFVTHDVEEALLLAQRVLVFSPRPAHILQEVKLSLPYPRNRTHPDFTSAYEQVAGLLLRGKK